MAANPTAGDSDRQRAAILGEILEIRTHLTNPAMVATADEPHTLAAACYALPGYARELNRHRTPRLWPYRSGYADGLRRDELLLAIGHLIAGFEDHTLDNGDLLISRATICHRICRLRNELVGPTPGDPSKSVRASAVDALAFTGACYALPVYAREVGRFGIPLLWPWPRGLYRQHDRGVELLLAAAMLLAETERQDRIANAGKRSTTVVVVDGVLN